MTADGAEVGRMLDSLERATALVTFEQQASTAVADVFRAWELDDAARQEIERATLSLVAVNGWHGSEGLKRAALTVRAAINLGRL